MKRTFLPPVRDFLKVIAFILLVAISIWYTAEGVYTLTAKFPDNLGSSLFAAFFTLMMLAGICVFILLLLVSISNGLRVIQVETGLITQGWILKDTYRPDEISAFGIAPFYGTESGKELALSKPVIYMICGEFDKDSFRRHGVGDVCFLTCMQKGSDKWLDIVYTAANLLGDNLDDIVIPEKMFWLKYSDENYRMLEAWLG